MDGQLLFELLFAFIVAAIITGVLYIVLKNTGPWGRAWTVFITLFFVIIAVSEWFTPVGPAAYGFYWLPGLLAAVLIAFLLASGSPSGPRKKMPRNDEDPGKTIRPESYYSPHAAEPRGEREGDETPVGVKAFGVLFWVFLVLLAGVAVVGIVS